MIFTFLYTQIYETRTRGKLQLQRNKAKELSKSVLVEDMVNFISCGLEQFLLCKSISFFTKC